MKLFSSKVIHKLDVDTIAMGTPQLELIDNACKAFVRFIIPSLSKTQKTVCLCGTGNNGVDGLYIAIKLAAKGYDVSVVCIESKTQLSLHYLDAKASISSAHIPLITIDPHDELISLEKYDVIIDGIFGNGLNRPFDNKYASLVNSINSSNKEVYAIDVPSGMQAEGDIVEPIVRCTTTLTFQMPRLSFFQREAAAYLGDWTFLPIGISTQLIEKEETDCFLIDLKFARSLFKLRAPHGHKGTYGTVVIIGGGLGMAGSIILSATASLKIGAGKCSIISEECNRPICQVNIPEASFIAYEGTIPNSKKNAFGIGPGLGTNSKSKEFLIAILKLSTKPIVIDADALNIIADNPELLKGVPKNSILTPHTGEFHNLFGQHPTDYQRITTQTELAKKNKLFIVLKGKYTTIACPDGELYFNNTGNSGMATGGSGDVLTGMITGLLAQGYTPKEACILGVYLHGMSGDLAKEDLGDMSLMAQDLITYLPLALNRIRS